MHFSSGITEEELKKRIKEDPEKTICITHRRDLDGLGSAAFLVHYIGLPIGNVVFSDHEQHDMGAALDIIKGMSLEGGTAIFTDLPLQEDINGIAEDMIALLKGNDNVVAWLDHHRVDDASENAIRKSDFAVYDRNKEMCASELVYEHLIDLRDDYGRYLAEMAHASDFYVLGTKYHEQIVVVGGAITYANYSNDDNGLRRIITDMARGEYLSSFIRKNSADYEREAEINAEKLRKVVVKYKVGELTIGIGHAIHIDANDACRAIMIDELKCNIGVLIAEDRINMRSEDTVDCSLLAKSLGGGGHPQAAGATPHGSDFKTEEGRNAIRKRILDKAMEIYAPEPKQ